MSELLLNTIIDKLNSHAQLIDILKEKVENLAGYSETLSGIDNQINSIRKDIQKISFPEKEMQQLALHLKQATVILQQPRKNEIINHHYVPKLTWVTAGLFLLLCLVCSRWYITSNNLQSYIANDTKYRYLKLNTNKNLQELLRITDSLYILSSNMRDSVLAKEEENLQKLELNRQADEKEKEADELRFKANHPEK